MVLGSLIPPCQIVPEEGAVRWAARERTGGAAGVQTATQRWHAPRRGPWRGRWDGLGVAEARGLVLELRSPRAATRGLVISPADGSEPFQAIVVGAVEVEGSGAAAFTVSCQLEERLP